MLFNERTCARFAFLTVAAVTDYHAILPTIKYYCYEHMYHNLLGVSHLAYASMGFFQSHLMAVLEHRTISKSLLTIVHYPLRQTVHEMHSHTGNPRKMHKHACDVL